MSPQPQLDLAHAAPAPPEVWGGPTRLAFRFCFVYFTLFCLTTQILGGLFPIPKLEIPDLASLVPVRPVVLWTASHVFGLTKQLVYQGSGSGDKTFDWVLCFCLLVVAAAATIVWSVFDRRRPNYSSLYRWFRLFIRFALASELFLYGVDKAVPLQMPFPFLTRLLEPYGNFSLMGVLWSSVGASRSYEVFAGCAEIFGGLFLLFPRTTTFGASIALIDMTQVFMLNMTYDVPVKLFSFHLLVLSFFLLAPDLPRLWRFFFLNRAAEPSNEHPLFLSARANRLALAAQAIFGALLFAGNLYGAANAWYQYGPGRPKPPLYGIWEVSKISTPAGAPVPDYDQWRRLVFDFPTQMAVQRKDDAFTYYTAKFDPQARIVSLSGNGKGQTTGQFTYDRPTPATLTLTGALNLQKITLELKLLDTAKFPLVSRGFHWIQEYPYNR